MFGNIKIKVSKVVKLEQLVLSDNLRLQFLMTQIHLVKIMSHQKAHSPIEKLFLTFKNCNERTKERSL